MQSSDYVPGVSGWKFDAAAGEFEVHSSSAGQSTEPRLIGVEAGCWSACDLPANALELLAFLEAELDKIPAECRASAELTTKDISFDCDGSDVRTTLTYERKESSEEVANRIEKSSLSAHLSGLACANFSIFHDGQLRVRIGSLEEPGPFIVAGGKVYMRDQALKNASETGFPASWSMKLDQANGKWICAGMGVALDVNSSGVYRPDIIVKASHMDILPDGLVRIKLDQN